MPQNQAATHSRISSERTKYCRSQMLQRNLLDLNRDLCDN
jgi:hypothetical protein